MSAYSYAWRKSMSWRKLGLWLLTAGGYIVAYAVGCACIIVAMLLTTDWWAY